MVGLSFSGTTFRSAHAVDPMQPEPGALQPARHESRSVFADATLDLSLGVHRRVALEASLPYRVVHLTTDYIDAQGKTLPAFVSIHHRDGWTVGPGDVSTMARVRLFAASRERPLRLDVRAGATWPLGGIEPNPDVLGMAGKVHNHVFFGSGTIDPQIGFDGEWSFDKVRFLGFGMARTSLYHNRYGYKQGARGVVGAGIDFSPGLMGWRFSVIPEVYHEQTSGWGMHIAENSGRTDVLVGVGATWMPAPRWFVQARVKVPAVTWADGGQLTSMWLNREGDLSSPWFAFVTVGHALELW